MTFEQHSSPERNKPISEDITQLRNEIQALEQQLDEAYKDKNLTQEQSAARTKDAAGILFKIATKKSELFDKEKNSKDATYREISGQEKAPTDTSYDLFEKQYRSLSKEQQVQRREELKGLLATLIKETRDDDTLQLLSDDFGSRAEKEFKIADLQKKVNILDKLIVLAEKFDVANPWADISKRA